MNMSGKSAAERKRTKRQRMDARARAAEREATRLRDEQRREQERLEERQQRLEADSARHEQRREQESLEERQQRLEANRASHAQRREQESLEEWQQRLEADRARHEQRRQQGRDEDQLRIAVQDFDMTPEILEERLDHEGEAFFQDFNTSVAKALLLFYVNSGLFRFQQYKDYCAKFDGVDIDQEKVGKEVMEELLTDEELQVMLKKFAEIHTYTNANLMSCGACGVREFERASGPELQYKKLILDIENPNASVLQ
jgi:hypothetical protein